MQKILKRDGSWEQQTSTTLKVFSLGETKGVRALTNIAGIIAQVNLQQNTCTKLFLAISQPILDHS